MNIKDFKVGQTVWMELVGNASRGKTSDECIEEWEVSSVGRKYIKAGKRSCDGVFGDRIWGETTFEYRENYGRFVQKTDFCVNYILHATRQEIEDEQEHSRLFNSISGIFREYGASRNLSLEQLQKIKSILDGDG